MKIYRSTTDLLRAISIVRIAANSALPFFFKIQYYDNGWHYSIWLSPCSALSFLNRLNSSSFYKLRIKVIL